MCSHISLFVWTTSWFRWNYVCFWQNPVPTVHSFIIFKQRGFISTTALHSSTTCHGTFVLTSLFSYDAENNWLKVPILSSFNMREVYELMSCDFITFSWIMNSCSSSTASPISLIKEKVSKQIHQILLRVSTYNKETTFEGWSWKQLNWDLKNTSSGVWFQNKVYIILKGINVITLTLF